MSKVLVIDDEKDITSLIEVVLKEEGFDVDTASSGFEALEKLEASGFNLVTLDIFMPGMDGWEFLRKMRGEKKFSGIKVVIFSILESKSAFETAEQMGVTLVPKSLGKDALLSQLRDVVI